MKQQAWDTISMSYVDIIMNSMGCLLVLFLLMVVIRGTVSLGADSAADEGVSAQPNLNAIEGGTNRAALQDPFVILVTSGVGSSQEPIFPDAGTGAWVLPDGFSAVTNTGPSFATLYALTPPTGPIRLKRLRGGHSLVVRVSQAGHELKPRRVPVRSGTADVWPAPEETKP
jgi:hypothetical protein